MPALLHARPPTDPAEERRLRKLAAARHAPASWIQRARIITGSWDGASVAELARRLDCHPKTVYRWLHRCNTSGIDGLADLPRPGVPRRISEHQRGRIIALARSAPPGRLHQGGEGLLPPAQPEAPAHWTLDALAQAAQAEGIQVGRSQVRQDPADRYLDLPGRLARPPTVAPAPAHPLAVGRPVSAGGGSAALRP